MYLGIRSTPSVSSYDGALAMFEKYSKTPTGRDRKPNWRNGMMQFASKATFIDHDPTTGDVTFRLHDTDCVVWHKDESFTVDPWESVTTAGFISALTPISVGHTMVATYFTTPMPDEGSYEGWQERWRQSRVCYAEGRFVPTEGGYEPESPRTFRYPVVDPKQTRALSKAHNIPDFERWLPMATMHLVPEHEGVDMGVVAEALLERDFIRAAKHLPKVKVPRGFGLAERMKPLAFKNVRYDEPITLASVAKFRRWLYDAEGAVTTAECATMTRAEYDVRIKAINAYEAAGVYSHCSGFGN